MEAVKTDSRDKPYKDLMIADCRTEFVEPFSVEKASATE
jgi:hypothetical protein